MSTGGLFLCQSAVRPHTSCCLVTRIPVSSPVHNHCKYIDKVADIPADVQRQVSTTQASQHDMQHIDEVVHVSALVQREVPTIPDTDDLCLDENADEDQLEHENKKRRLPMPTEAVFESLPTECKDDTDESDIDRFDDRVLPSPQHGGKALFVNISSDDEAEDGTEK